MQETTPSNLKLPEPWTRPDADDAASLHAELQRELPPGHLLYRVPVETFAWTGGGHDDTLFRWLNLPDRFTVIHLSWLGRTEINSKHPTVEFDGSFAEFLEYMRRFLEFLRSCDQNSTKRNKGET